MVLVAAVLLLAGCGKQPTTISGLVLLDGRPLAIEEGMHGTVLFQPANQEGPTLNGVINKHGHYTLAVGSNALVPPGEYLATVSAIELIPATEEESLPKGRRITPQKYATSAQSGLRVRVEPGFNTISLELSSTDATRDDPASKAAVIEETFATPSENHEPED